MTAVTDNFAFITCLGVTLLSQGNHKVCIHSPQSKQFLHFRVHFRGVPAVQVPLRNLQTFRHSKRNNAMDLQYIRTYTVNQTPVQCTHLRSKPTLERTNTELKRRAQTKVCWPKHTLHNTGIGIFAYRYISVYRH